MINRAHRFHGQASVRRTLTRGQSARGGMLGLKYVANERRSAYRLAVVVSRKVSKSAVVRNRIRRRIYECVRILSTGFSTPHDLVIGVYDVRVAELTSAELQVEIKRLFKKAPSLGLAQTSHGIVANKENR